MQETAQKIKERLQQALFDEATLAAWKKDERKAVQQAVAGYEKKLQQQAKERQRLFDLLAYERTCCAEGLRIIAGVDEAGRGPLAGPVVIGAAVLPEHEWFWEGLNDSKQVSAVKRDKLYAKICAEAAAHATVLVSAEEIDAINIYQAAKVGMERAVLSLAVAPQAVLADAMPLSLPGIKTISLIRGDALSASIAAASILAKVTRDRLMEEYDALYPEYGFADHKGYGTKQHLAALRKYGPCPIHRKSFAPVRDILAEWS